MLDDADRRALECTRDIVMLNVGSGHERKRALDAMDACLTGHVAIPDVIDILHEAFVGSMLVWMTSDTDVGEIPSLDDYLAQFLWPRRCDYEFRTAYGKVVVAAWHDAVRELGEHPGLYVCDEDWDLIRKTLADDGIV